eukprot:1569413-Alexandrium_andersonii.AAC.1
MKLAPLLDICRYFRNAPPWNPLVVMEIGDPGRVDVKLLLPNLSEQHAACTGESGDPADHGHAHGGLDGARGDDGVAL